MNLVLRLAVFWPALMLARSSGAQVVFHVVRVTPNGTAALTLGSGDTPRPVEQPYLMVMTQS